MSEEIKSIIDNNRKLIKAIVQKIQNGKKLTNEQTTYLTILFNSDMIKADGSLTKEGINALYK